MGRKLVYLFRNEKGLYYIDGSRCYFADRFTFSNAKEGFAFVDVLVEKEDYGFVTGNMVYGCGVDLDRFGALLYTVGGRYWNVCSVGGCEVAWVFEKSKLLVFLCGGLHTCWGGSDYSIYKELSKLDNRSVYVYGYYIKNIVDTIGCSTSVQDVIVCDMWDFSSGDSLYIFGDKIVMFEPVEGSVKNKGVMWGGVHKYLNEIETVKMWEFLCGAYGEDMKKLVV